MPKMNVLYVAAAGALLVNSAYAANLIKNGSFEKPVVTAGGYEQFSTGDTFAGWKVVGATGNVAIASGAFEQGGFTFPAAGGSQWLDLTGNSNTATGVAQTVATTVGTAYTLTFYIGNVDDPGGVWGTTSKVNVFVDGTQVYAATNSRGAGQTKLVWQKFSTTITATSEHTTIAFMNGDPPTDNSNGLDLISLVEEADEEPAAVPQPRVQD